MTDSRKPIQVAILSLSLVFFWYVVSFSSWPEFWISSDCFPGNAYRTQSSPAVARGENSVLVVWEDERITADRDIFCTRITNEGSILDPVGVPICTALGPQTRARVAAGDQGFLVVWQDQRNDTYDIYAARIDVDGNVLDPDGFPVSTGPQWEESPDVAWDGTNFMLVWSDDRSMISPDIYGVRIAPSGEILDNTVIQVSSWTDMEFSPSVTYNGLNYLVAWEVGAG